jgi:hypothetical protein
VGYDFEDLLLPTILEGKLMFLGVLNTSLGPMKVLGVWNASSYWGLPSTTLPSELLYVL